MTEYKCGHKSELLVIDSNPLSIMAYFEWSEFVGREGTKEKCWECWCKEKETKNES